ncbi:MAG: cysteine--tRNA ligase [Bacteroidales bacterium]|nr:cysteine--tRNA ligase [Bacteroidales bacterium]
MSDKLFVYNTLSRKKEVFEPINPPFVGMYVCGPTVYGDAHLGHARPAVSFDLIYRYLKHLGYNVRYVRNITDVGHLVNDADQGEDKIAKKARLEKLEPMEIVQYYTQSYHKNMEQLNTLSPNIEPRATGHIIDQIEMVKKIIDNGFAYVVNGSVYFDVEKYNKKYNYGKLSGRNLESLRTNTRTLQMQDEKKNNFDFALWKKALPEHIMRWPSPWSEGFPGWHIECSTMSTKYLGERFDIHGGGMDLVFPHHESEIAQSVAANKTEPVKYWIHNNMITIKGQKMGKSLNNFITLNDLFSGNNKVLSQAFSPMTIRFFILQAHYRSTLDFSNEALIAAEKGLKKLLNVFNVFDKLKTSGKSSFDVKEIQDKCYQAMNDDFNSPIVIAHLFDAVRMINSVKDNKETISAPDLELLKKIFNVFVFEILGLKSEKDNDQTELIDGLMQMILSVRQNAKNNKDYATSDKIRDELLKLNIKVKDTKDGAEWQFE